jgi:hypothetical protein
MGWTALEATPRDPVLARGPLALARLFASGGMGAPTSP